MATSPAAADAERMFRLAREAHRDGRHGDADFYRKAARNAKVRAGLPAHDTSDVRAVAAMFSAQFQGRNTAATIV